MLHTYRIPLVALCAALSIGLAGCERAEQAAESVTKEAGRIAAEEARKALQSTGEALNRGIDSAQETTRRWMDGADRAAQERRQDDAPAPPPARLERGEPAQSI
jgi:hypothetical protein